MDDERGRADEGVLSAGCKPISAVHDHRTRWVDVSVVPREGDHTYTVDASANVFLHSGQGKVIFKTENRRSWS